MIYKRLNTNWGKTCRTYPTWPLRLFKSVVQKLLRHHQPLRGHHHSAVLRSHSFRWIRSLLWQQRLEWVRLEKLWWAYMTEICFRSTNQYSLCRSVSFTLLWLESWLQDILRWWWSWEINQSKLTLYFLLF